VSDPVIDGETFAGVVEAIAPGESIKIDGESHPLAPAANVEPEVEVGARAELIKDSDGIVTSVRRVDGAPPPDNAPAQASPRLPDGPPPGDTPPPPPRPPARSAPPPDPEDLVRMSLVEHLEELRDRLIKSAAALAITTALSLVIAKQVLNAFRALLPGEAPLQAFTPTETYVVYFKVALLCGLALAMPLIVYQILAFIVPGLTKQERRWLYVVAPGAGLLFLAGLLFAYFVILPFGLPILQGFLSDVVVQQWRLDYYISFVVRFLMITGLIFETPLVIYFLSKVGLITQQRLAQSRRYAIVVAAGTAALLTPTTDPFTMLLVMGPMILLYELGVFLARFT
jgi:sec-independent protein translocase protein TatC